MSEKKVVEQVYRPLLTREEKVWMFAAVIRNEEVMARAVGLLKDEHFDENDKWLLMIWIITRNYYQEYATLPTRRLIATGCNAFLEASPDFLRGEAGDINSFLTLAFEMTLEDMPMRPVLASLKRFLEDRLVHDAKAALALPQTPLGLSSVFSNLAVAASEVSALENSGLTQPFAEGWDTEVVSAEYAGTKISFLDYFLERRQVCGESYGLMGPTGGGKTTIGVMITANAAQAEYDDWTERGQVGVPRRVYHASYEELRPESLIRVLSYLAEIPKKRLERAVLKQSYDTLSRDGNYRDYELARYQQQLANGFAPGCEYDRLVQAQEVLNQCWRFVDLTGSDPEYPGRGCGLVEEIATIIRSDMAASGAGCRLVLADYVMAAVSAHMRQHNIDTKELRHYINDWSSQMRRRIGAPFGCPVWSIQQLSAESNSCRPGHLPSGADSQEGKAFQNSCNFCFVIGLPTHDGNVPFIARKHRRTRTYNTLVLKIRGDYSRVNDVSKTWVFDERTKQIVRRNELTRFTEAAAPIDEQSKKARKTVQQQTAVRASGLEKLR